MNYAILIKPNNNIAFVDQYMVMCQTELKVMASAYGLTVSDVGVHKINKAMYLNFAADKPIDHEVQKSVYQLSFFHMLFVVVEGGMYKPVVIDYEPDFADDLSVRMKYSGKTNEQVTRMMMMMAYHVSDFVGHKGINLLDPLCGRGTTLFEAMISGFNAYGVERDKKSFMEMTSYITRYIKDARFKHTNKRGKVINERQAVGESFELEYAKDKAKYKAGDLNVMKVLRGDTTNIKGAFSKNSMHLIVADLPYNVQHKGKGVEEIGGLAGLLKAGLAEWDFFLKKGGAVAVSWNVYTDTRESFVEILEEAGYQVMQGEGFESLKHRVAQAITRDIRIAKKI